jgi:hypothetical protein
MANELHELLYNLGVPERWNLPLHIMGRDVQALREDVFPIPTTFRKEGVVKTAEKKRKASPIEDLLSPRNLSSPAIS